MIIFAVIMSINCSIINISGYCSRSIIIMVHYNLRVMSMTVLIVIISALEIGLVLSILLFIQVLVRQLLLLRTHRCAGMYSNRITLSYVRRLSKTDRTEASWLSPGSLRAPAQILSPPTDFMSHCLIPIRWQVSEGLAVVCSASRSFFDSLRSQLHSVSRACGNFLLVQEAAALLSTSKLPV